MLNCQSLQNDGPLQIIEHGPDFGWLQNSL
ncbi:hypothetical protein BANRA_05086 [Klebsiella pneumoniae]|nr:hypothetical protein AI2770V1_4964 [Klebsiella pneumoniae]CAD2017114.1 hypothetical protein AI2764V1_4968 [Klebsiella pneumoniae]CAD2017638.1 hypothetical protein AI2775V1_4964 [Klebsiella pneumoniae]CAD2018053.1 hypothetical protein AI2763V1_4950 [Klebsiella pneumoniae]CAD2018410.1 hypothetical protein AI2767V1_4956 [Klebsiella pneumoniae]